MPKQHLFDPQTAERMNHEEIEKLDNQVTAGLLNYLLINDGRIVGSEEHNIYEDG